jgi:NADH dehydrogenase FAD-containing subunit
MLAMLNHADSTVLENAGPAALHRIVIIGGGAGGLELATRLGDKLNNDRQARVVLVDRAATHLWKPFLHEVAAGSMDANAHQLNMRRRPDDIISNFSRDA